MSLERLKTTLQTLGLHHAAEEIVHLWADGTPAQTKPLELFDRILSHEVEVREARRRATALKLSGLPRGMTLETFDFAFQPDVDRDRVDELATGEFIRNHENVLFFGPPGVGKTHLAVALGVRAVELGYSVYYATMDDLMARLKKRAHLPVAQHRRQAYLKCALLIVDELGYQAFDRQETHAFFQLVAARYLKGSLILTSNRPARDWVKIFAHDELVTTAMLDRLFHRSHLFNIDGRSYRLKDYQTALNEPPAS